MEKKKKLGITCGNSLVQVQVVHMLVMWADVSTFFKKKKKLLERATIFTLLQAVPRCIYERHEF